jgi:hypothetical protein
VRIITEEEDNAKEWLPSPKDNINDLNISKILGLLEDFSYRRSIKTELEVLEASPAQCISIT